MRHFNAMMIRSTPDLLMRVLWLALTVVHIGPVLRVASSAAAGELSAGRWISLVVLLLSLIFFALKTLGVPFLRVRCRWTGVVLFLVACGLLHGNAKPQDWLEKTGYTVLVVGSVAGASESVRRAVRRRGRELAERLVGVVAALAALIRGLAYLDALRLLSRQVEVWGGLVWKWLEGDGDTSPRGPPACAGHCPLTAFMACAAAPVERG